MPFAFDGTGHAHVNEQDTLEDVAGCVLNIASCPAGFRQDAPNFGIPELLFQTLPLDLAALERAIARDEPRAALQASQAVTAPGAIAISQAVGLKDSA